MLSQGREEVTSEGARVARGRIGLIESVPLFADGVTRLLEGLGYRVETVATTVEEARRMASSSLDVIVLDAQMLAVDDTLVRTLRAGGQAVLVLAGEGRPGLALRALADGASGYVPRSVGTEELDASLRAVVVGAAVISRPMAMQSAEWLAEILDERVGSLSDDEMELWAQLARDRPLGEIAAERHVSERTARRMIADLLEHLGVSTRVQAAELAGRVRLLDAVERMQGGGRRPWWTGAVDD